MDSKHRARGFTIIELLVVIAIIAIIAAGSIPAGLSYLRNYRVIGSAQNVAAQMQMARGQAVKRNANRGILLNFNFPDVRQFQFTSLEADPWTGNWDGQYYPNFAPRTYLEGMVDFGAVPATPFNVEDPDPANGIQSPHGQVHQLGQNIEFQGGTFNALLFRADGSVRAVNAAGGGVPVIQQVGVDYELVIRDPVTDLSRLIRISRNGRVQVAVQ